MTVPAAPIANLAVSAFVIPTDAPESDGTFEWNSTTMVLVEAEAGGRQGLGYTYADAAAATIIASLLAPAVRGIDALDVPAAWTAMTTAVRNNGRPGLSSCAISAVDSALWDLKGKLLDLAVVDLTGAARNSVPVYGSGGFTSYSVERLQEQLHGWVAQGIGSVKMKVGRDPALDVQRVAAARAAIGDAAGLFVDANGAHTPKRALQQAARFAEHDVSWFEEPVSSDDLRGLAMLVQHAPAGMEIAAGEYGYDSFYFERMLAAGAVDVLQADATRCGGITGFLRTLAIAEAHAIPVSAHTAPSLHAHPCSTSMLVRHIEYFHDHVHIERELFDGAAVARGGVVQPDRGRPGLGLELKRRDAERYRRM